MWHKQPGGMTKLHSYTDTYKQEFDAVCPLWRANMF